MKKVIIGLLVLLLALSVCGCGKRASERMAEKMLATAGLDADVDISGDKVVIKGADGESMTFGSDKWPTSDLAKKIPEYKGGKIVSVMETSDSVFVMVENVSDADFAKYLNEVKETFSESTYELTTDTGMIYMATDGKDLSISLTYEKDSGLTIAVAETDTENE